MPENAKLEDTAKVVHLEPESQRIIRARLARLPAAIHAAHEKGKHVVLGLLKAFFDRADDSLFELADKAQSNQEQNLYFDSMREVRVQRRNIEKRFAEAIDHGFAAMVSPDQNLRRDDPVENLSSDTLSLVHNDDLEEMVAVDASVARANGEFGEQIQQISLRLDSLVPVKIYQKNNPLGPDVICAAFMEQAKRLDVGIKAKLVLFKLFDKAVINHLGEVYKPVNQLFVDHNILPSLSGGQGGQNRRSTDARPRNSGATAGLGGGMGTTGQNFGAEGTQLNAQGATPTTVNPEVLDALRNILGEQAVSPNNSSQPPQNAANQLLDLLSKAQHLPVFNSSPEVAINVRSILSQLQQQTGVQASIGRVDDEVMNLVNMLFDFILEDRNLAPPMKALISRMQIPIIKVAVADKSFFTKGGHVARRLLNEMATASIGWQGDAETCKKDPLYRKIDGIIRHLIDNFDADIRIFAELLADFTGFLEKEKRRAAVLERRTIDAEDGKAKAEIARTIVSVEVELRTLGYRLPDIVEKLINDAWNNVLFVTGLKYGYESDEWTSALSALEELVWSVQPPRSVEHRQKLIKLVPSLLKKLRTGLDSISYNPFEMSELFKSLENVHLACIREKILSPEQIKKKAEAEQLALQKQAAAEKAAVQKASQAQSPAPATAASQPANTAPSGPLKHSAAKKSPTGRSAVATPSDKQAKGAGASLLPPNLSDLARSMEIEELPIESTEHTDTAGEEQKTARQRLVDEASALKKPVTAAHTPTGRSASQATGSDELPSDDPQMQQVGQFVQGAWFDMEDARGTSMRCRLAAYIKPTGKYIFVNRNGMKIAEKTKTELAFALKNNALRALDNSMLFDRALETVVTSLRKN